MRALLFVSLLIISFILIGCGKQAMEKPSEDIAVISKGLALPPAIDELLKLTNFENDDIGKWKLASPVKIYDRKTIFDYIDGAAEIYLAYDFCKVANSEYKNNKTSIIIDLYDMANTENAFGIYSLNRYQVANYVNIGNEGILTDAILDFWKGRYYCKIYALDTSVNYKADVKNFGSIIASKIDEEASEPDIISKLPKNGMIPRSAKYFTRKLGLDNVHYVSDINVFNLDGETKGAMAEYLFNGAKAEIFIIEYPSIEKAKLAFETYDKYLCSKGESVYLDESSENNIRMVNVDGKFAFVKVKEESLIGFWDVETKEVADSIYLYMK